jgi:hypothetical protein
MHLWTNDVHSFGTDAGNGPYASSESETNSVGTLIGDNTIETTSTTNWTDWPRWQDEGGGGRGRERQTAT